MIFLDCDGVLADFDKRAAEILGQDPRTFEMDRGKSEFWETIYATDDFFYSLDPMSDAHYLVETLQKAGLPVAILTGIPSREPNQWAIPQKQRWKAKHFPTLTMHTCLSKDKSLHCYPGDIIIDDWPEHMSKWIERKGIWVHHDSAENSIKELRKLGVL